MMTTIPTIDLMRTGQNIDRLRRQAGLSVKDMQDEFGFGTPQAIYKWIAGINVPTVDNLLILSAMFGVRIDDIIICNVVDDQKDIGA